MPRSWPVLIVPVLNIYYYYSKNKIKCTDAFWGGGKLKKYFLEEEKFIVIYSGGFLGVWELHEYFKASLIKLRANTQSCQLDGSHSRRGGTSSNETGRYVKGRVELQHPERVCCALVFGGQLYIIRKREIFSPPGENFPLTEQMLWREPCNKAYHWPKCWTTPL